MPSPAPQPAVPVFALGDYVLQSELNALGEHARLLYDWSVSGYRTQRPMCAMQVTGGSLNDYTFVALSFQTEIVDTDGMFTPGASHVWIRTPGVYLIDFQACLQPQSSSVPAGRYFGTIVGVNGLVRETDTVAYDKVAAGPSQHAVSRCSALVPLNEGAIIYFAVEQNTGTGLTNVAFETNDGGCRASVEWMGPLAPEIGRGQ